VGCDVVIGFTDSCVKVAFGDGNKSAHGFNRGRAFV
jgi:hypothetical protein